MARRIRGLLSLLSLLHIFICTKACTVIELDSSGFANNAYSLMHAIPMFLGRNGTTFLDNTNFQYKCSEDGGWHDFFSGEEDLVPWSATKEAATGETCARYTLQKIDELMYNTVQTKPDLLDFIGVKRVRYCMTPLPGRTACAHLQEALHCSNTSEH